MRLVLTCEHAFPDIPEKHLYLFTSKPEVLKTHKAFDPGAFDLFTNLKDVADFAHFQQIGRLLIESNRSLWHKNLYSRYSLRLSKEEKQELLDTYYIPYRKKVESAISSLIADGQIVLHLSIHSFTPVFNEQIRNADIGLLYDPGREIEKVISRRFKYHLLKQNSDLKIRFNYPYLGKADGFTTALRRLFPENYIGIEIEINQKWVKDNLMSKMIKATVKQAVKEIVKA